MITNQYDLLETGFPQDGSTPCFMEPGKAPISYGSVRTIVSRCAALLKTRGVGVGDRVVVQCPKSPHAVMLYLAVLKIGAIFVPLNTAYTNAETDYFLSDAQPKLFVTDAVAFVDLALPLSPVESSYQSRPTDVAAIIYTSGTTGRSKGAMLTHSNLMSNSNSLRKLWAFTKRDVLIHALPIFHIHGLFVAVHCSLLSGSSMIWLAKFDESAVLNALPRATVMMGVPTFYSRLLANEKFNRSSTSNVRLFISGSAPLLASAFHDFEARTGHTILERYGMSEALIISSNPLEGGRGAGSVGYPLPGVHMRIAGGNETGIIEVCGPNVFCGYWQLPEKTREEFTADGYFITGDIGRIDSEGRVWISGRAKDLIISGGFNIYPKEVELIIDSLPGVRESAVIGVPHPDFGEAVIAVIAGNGAENEIITAARNQLAGFKTPKRVFFVRDLPRNTMGKVQKNDLRAKYNRVFVADG